MLFSIWPKTYCMFNGKRIKILNARFSNEKIGSGLVKKIDDNTAENVEILVHLAQGVSSDKTIDALFAFTDCEVSISPNSCVIDEEKPNFMGVSEMLKLSARNTVGLLTLELEIRKKELENSWHQSSLEKIFIENRIYRDIEECETWESILEAIEQGLEPFKNLLLREVTRDDIVRLTEIKIKRISKFDSNKADDLIRGIEAEIEEVNNHLANIISYTINYFKQIKKKHGKDKERRTEIKNFDTIVATKVVAKNARLYVNREEGFAGTSLKKDEYVCDCSDIDEIIVFLRDGRYIITKNADKLFIGKDIIHIAVFKKNDSRTIYNAVYRDGRNGNVMVKRAAVTGVTRDKEYHFTRGKADSKILYFSANPNGEAETIKIQLKPKPRLKTLTFEFDFSELSIKCRNSLGNILTKKSVLKIALKEKGVSTLGGRKIWFDEDVNRLNADNRGRYLGEFSANDKILVIMKSGKFRLSNFDLANHYEDDILILEKFVANKVYSAIYFDAGVNYYYIKRFSIEHTEKPLSFINGDPESRMVSLTEVEYPRFEIKFGGKNKSREPEIIEVAEFIGIKSFKAKGKRLTNYHVENIKELEPVVKKEGVVEEEGHEDPVTKEEEDELMQIDDDNGQMKLDLK